MLRLIPLLLIMRGYSSMARAEPPKTAPFSTQFHGDGGGYTHPDPAVSHFFETKTKSREIPAKITPPTPPVDAPARVRPRPFAPTLVPEKGEDDRSTLDSVSEDARHDYEARILGAMPAPRLPGLKDSAPIASTKHDPGEGMLFVSLELDPKEAGTLRDAVAGLSQSVAFRSDARFQPLPGPGGSVRVSGWLPVSRLGEVIARPGVKRVAVESGSRPGSDNHVTGDYLLILRVSAAARPDESITESVRDLTAKTGFKLSRVFGFETIPGKEATALVSGALPIAQLSRVLARPDVIKIRYMLPTLRQAPVVALPIKREGFLKFVMARGQWLVLLTLLLVLVALGEAVKKGLSIFIPYR